MFSIKKNKSPIVDVLVEIPEWRDERGALSVVQGLDKDFRRAFWIYDVPKGASRGGHAHRTCDEFFVAVRGCVTITLDDGKDKCRVTLSRPTQGLIIRPMVWCELTDFSEDFVGVCLATQDYLPEGYLYNYDEFLREFN